MEIIPDKKPLWRKITQGFLRIETFRRPKVKPGEIIRATSDQLGDHIRHFELIEPGTGTFEGDRFVKYAEAKPKPPVLITKEPLFHVNPVEKAPGWYNILDRTGKVMNEKKLRAKEAEELRKQLSGE